MTLTFSTSHIPLLSDNVLVGFNLVSLFNGMSTFVGYLMPKPSLLRDSNDSI